MGLKIYISINAEKFQESKSHQQSSGLRIWLGYLNTMFPAFVLRHVRCL